jgi:hypothetical protein
MSIRTRLEALERRVGRSKDVVVSILLAGSDEERWRRRAEEARRCGYRLRIVRFTTVDQADTLEEAEAVIQRHKEVPCPMPITVYRGASRDGDPWVTWDPGLPDWLVSAMGSQP